MHKIIIIILVDVCITFKDTIFTNFLKETHYLLVFRYTYEPHTENIKNSVFHNSLHIY